MAAIYDSPYKGSGQLTRAQFLFYETRTTAKLMTEGLDDAQIVDRIISENLFQYPTEKSLKTMAKTCIARLHALQDDTLIQCIATSDSATAKQICLFAMMRQYRLIWDFMITVIGEKYHQQDFSFRRQDINVFFLQLQEQDDYVASWSEQTCKKIGSVLMRILIENEYIDGSRSCILNPVLISRALEEAIRDQKLEIVLPAFNCFI